MYFSRYCFFSPSPPPKHGIRLPRGTPRSPTPGPPGITKKSKAVNQIYCQNNFIMFCFMIGRTVLKKLASDKKLEINNVVSCFSLLDPRIPVIPGPRARVRRRTSTQRRGTSFVIRLLI